MLLSPLVREQELWLERDIELKMAFGPDPIHSGGELNEIVRKAERKVEPVQPVSPVEHDLSRDRPKEDYPKKDGEPKDILDISLEAWELYQKENPPQDYNSGL